MHSPLERELAPERSPFLNDGATPGVRISQTCFFFSATLVGPRLGTEARRPHALSAKFQTVIGTPNLRNVFLDLVFSNVENVDVCSALDSLFPENLHHSLYSWSISVNLPASLESEIQVLVYSSICWDTSLVSNTLG
ncbi:hypothetical protein Zmor_021604 [Zophobas morio]|uniref:Uncharacterized protein n=1 Tax=Zophobas morio TaxID=2755281 RepID=A0AA38I916_9CUCU|nr:hypothetical protein Zmor_021604 [Zophobas morio]